MIFVFLWLTSLSMIISRSIHVAENGIISFFFMAEQFSGLFLEQLWLFFFRILSVWSWTLVASRDSVTSFWFCSVSPFLFAPHLPPIFPSASDMSVIKYAFFSPEDLRTCCSSSTGQLSSGSSDLHPHLIQVSENMNITSSDRQREREQDREGRENHKWEWIFFKGEGTSY